jgi:hypothetical protein
VDLKYFSVDEFDCQETGENEMQESFLLKLDHLREACGFPFTITSGYRSPEHSIERSKANGPGMHSSGLACDIAVSGGNERYLIQKHAYGVYRDRCPPGICACGYAGDYTRVLALLVALLFLDYFFA